MTTSTICYQGNLRTTAIHLQSNNEIITDAPIDNHGKGEAFSPTDLVATALGSCMLTVMGIKAESIGIDLTNTKVEITKHMQQSPRMIKEIVVAFHIPLELDDQTKSILEKTAHTCPVSQSLHPDVIQNIVFHYKS